MVEIEFRGYTFDTGLIIVFISAFIMLIWIILKLFRVIETPLIFELAPFMASLVVIFGFGMTIGKIVLSSKYLQNDMKEVKTEVKEIRDEMVFLKADFKHFVRYRKSLS